VRAGEDYDAKFLDLRRHNDAIQMTGLAIELERGTDVKAKVRRWLLQDFVWRNRYPHAIDFDLVMIIDLSTRRRSTIRQIAAWSFGIGALETLIKAMPLVMPLAQITFLRCRRLIQDQRK
jgi:hypothetical protein